MTEESDGSRSAGDEAEVSAEDGADRGAHDPWSDGWELAADRTVEEGGAAENGSTTVDEPSTATVDEPAGARSDETAGAPSDADGDDEYEPSIAGVFGARPEDAPPRPEIVPETPSLENVFFVLVGVLFGLFVIYRAATVFAG